MLKLTIENPNDANQKVTTNIEVFAKDEDSMLIAGKIALRQALETLGFVAPDTEIKMSKEDWDMENDVKKGEQTQDLTHHKTEETDNLVKAEHPDDDFMRQKHLDPETHGKEHEDKK